MQTSDGTGSPRVHPEIDRRMRVRRQLLRLFCGVLFVSGTVYALFGEAGLADRMRLAREQERLEADVAAREARIRGLRQARDGLRTDPLRRERIAREQLGYVRPGEVVFLLPD